MKIVSNVWPMMVVFIVALTLLRFFYLQNHRERFCLYKEFIYLIAILYIWLLFEILTMTELNSYGGMNLVPFSEILRYKIGTKIFNYNVIGNILIFIPFIFGTILNFTRIGNMFVAFFAFSFMASAIYIINDLKDIEKDKLHPKKCLRPIASGKVSKSTAVIIAILMFCGSVTS